MVSVTPFDAEGGFAAFVQWLAISTDGVFFLMALIVLFLIAFIPSLIKWGIDWSLFGSSFGVMLLAIIIYFMKGLSENVLFGFIILFLISVLKITIFKE